jgi:hypothetical protein
MEPHGSIGKLLIILGAVIIILGLGMVFGDKFPLNRIPLGRLPGDIIIRKPNFTFYFPLTTGVLISLVIGIIHWLIKK